MNLLKHFLFAGILVSSFTAPAQAAEEVDARSVGNYYVASPEDVANIQLYSNKDIDYMVENYTLPELARTAVRINKSQINAAKRSGNPIPPKLTGDDLSSKEKIAEYLRSQYKFSY